MEDPYDPMQEFRDIEAELQELEEAGETDSIRYKALKSKLETPPTSMGTFGSPIEQIRQKADQQLARAGWHERRQRYEEERDDG